MREMKDSGNLILGEIPVEWSSSRLKYNLVEVMKYGASETGIDYDASLCRYIRITDITSDGKLKEENKLSLTNSQANGYILQDKTILFARSGGTVGKSFIYYSSYGKSAFAGYLISAVANKSKMLPEWLMYYANSAGYWEWVNQIFTQATIQNIGADKYSNMPIAIAPIEEQEKIVSFLDAKCSEIDALSADIQSEIDTLQAYKRSVITEAVTKGLDRNASLKDSGTDWIGAIPSNWSVSKLGNVLTLRNERNYKPLEEVNLISLYTDRGVVQHADLEKTSGNIAQNADGYKIVHRNDIVVNIILAWMGAMGISDYDGVTSPAYDVYKINMDKIYPHYCHYILRSPALAGECYKYGRGIMMMRWRTYSTEFKKIKIPLPTVEEQKKIADYLDAKCKEIDFVITQKQEQLEVIAEYKKSLIYEYVTGKKEVPVV